jgi:3-hydroxyisobutyrate dehydrogenase-like beta-hydroxyacid dehydrogenase
MTDRLRYAIIGLGRMGGPMAGHAVDAGHDVVVYDVANEAVATSVAQGTTAAASPGEAATGAACVSIVVFDDAQVLSVLDGPDGVLAALQPGAVVTIHTTVTLDTIHAAAALGAACGVAVLDAGISGGEEGAGKGTLVTMLGGPAEAVEHARPALMSFSKEVLHAGPLGAGMALKLARNAAGYIMMAAAHEAMELAHHSGVDLNMLQHTIEATGVLQQAMAPFILGGPVPLADTETGGLRGILEHTNKLASKDLDQAIDLARQIDAVVPIIEATREHFHRVTRL